MVWLKPRWEPGQTEKINDSMYHKRIDSRRGRCRKPERESRKGMSKEVERKKIGEERKRERRRFRAVHREMHRSASGVDTYSHRFRARAYLVDNGIQTYRRRTFRTCSEPHAKGGTKKIPWPSAPYVHTVGETFRRSMRDENREIERQADPTSTSDIGFDRSLCVQSAQQAINNSSLFLQIQISLVALSGVLRQNYRDCAAKYVVFQSFERVNLVFFYASCK